MSDHFWKRIALLFDCECKETSLAGTSFYAEAKSSGHKRKDATDCHEHECQFLLTLDRTIRRKLLCGPNNGHCSYICRLHKTTRDKSAPGPVLENCISFSKIAYICCWDKETFKRLVHGCACKVMLLTRKHFSVLKKVAFVDNASKTSLYIQVTLVHSKKDPDFSEVHMQTGSLFNVRRSLNNWPTKKESFL